MSEYRLAWEPTTGNSPSLVSSQVMKYMDHEATFAQLPNDTCVMLKPVENLDEVVFGCMAEARRLPDFKVYAMKEGDYLVFFASALIVYVGKDEFTSISGEIERRKNELMFPGEALQSPSASPRIETEELVGLYARGKLQHDAWSSKSYVVIRPNHSLRLPPSTPE